MEEQQLWEKQYRKKAKNLTIVRITSVTVGKNNIGAPKKLNNFSTIQS